MKKSFKEYHPFTPAETARLWDEAVIVLDTNVLLDFYAFGETTLADYFKVLKAVKKRGQLWMPNRVGYEFFERRVSIISKQSNQYENVLKYLDSPKELIAKLTETNASHAHLDFGKLSEEYEKSAKDLREKVEKLKNAHPDHLGADKVLTELEKIYIDSLVGKEYSDSQLQELIKEGEDRYSRKVPPGYKDDNKSDEEKPSANRKYGDLIIWKQMIDHAKDSKKPIIFVTNDAKDDWVQYAKGRRKLGPKPELKKEMLKEAKVDFELYSSDEFLDHVHKILKLKLNRDSVSEVKKYSQIESERVDVSTNPWDSDNYVHLSDGALRSRHVGYRNPGSIHSLIDRGLRQVRVLEEHTKTGSRVSYRMYETLNRLHRLYDEMHNSVRHGNLQWETEYSFRFSRYLSDTNDELISHFSPFDQDAMELIETNKRIITRISNNY